MSSDHPWLGQINQRSEINCYAVMIGGPDADLNVNTCKDAANGNVLMNFGPYVGGVPAGQTLKMTLKSGPKRKVYLMAMNAAAGSCKDFRGSGPDKDKISYPRLIGLQTVDLVPGDATIDFTIPSTLSTLSEIGDCEVDDIASGGGEGEEKPWSDGRDGSLAVAGFDYVDGDFDSIGGSATHTPKAGGVPSSKMFAFTSRVVGINSSDGKVLTLATTPADANSLSAGDTLFWHIGSGWAATNPDTNSCGGDLILGQWGTVKVASVSGASVTLEKPITDNPSTINNTSLSSGSPAEGTPHCLMQVVRMSAYDSVTIAAGASLGMTIPGWSPVNYKYGVLAVSIKNLNMDTGSTMNINLGANGHPSGSVGAFGLGTAGGSAAAYRNRPGVVGNQGGGGANAGYGGSSAGTAAPGGAPLNLCSGSVCSVFADKKAFFGAGGAGNGTSPGSNGGGFIFLLIENATGTGVINLNSSGGSAANTDAGGGAGGTIAMLMKSQSPSVTINTTTNGGDGNFNGGAGGGGLINVGRCQSLSTGALNDSSNPGSGGPGATSGVSYLFNLETTNPSYCN
jgi:hypothetical protein